MCIVFFFFNDTATTEIYTLSLHDALPIFAVGAEEVGGLPVALIGLEEGRAPAPGVVPAAGVLHLDDAGAEVAEHHPGVRPGEGAGQVDDEDAGEGTDERRGHSDLLERTESDPVGQPSTTNRNQTTTGATMVTTAA